MVLIPTAQRRHYHPFIHWHTFTTRRSVNIMEVRISLKILLCAIENILESHAGLTAVSNIFFLGFDLLGRVVRDVVEVIALDVPGGQ